jgi:hypothetical protein
VDVQGVAFSYVLDAGPELRPIGVLPGNFFRKDFVQLHSIKLPSRVLVGSAYPDVTHVLTRQLSPPCFPYHCSKISIDFLNFSVNKSI